MQSADVRFPDRNLVNQRLLRLFPETEGRAVLVSGSAETVGYSIYRERFLNFDRLGTFIARKFL